VHRHEARGVRSCAHKGVPRAADRRDNKNQRSRILFGLKSWQMLNVISGARRPGDNCSLLTTSC
jgi:hypothetical protein